MELVEALRNRLKRHEQCLLFLNRRGYAPLVICPECNETQTCPNCSLSLVFHQGLGQLRCHQCDHAVPMPSMCFACEAQTELKIVGSGTEQIEIELEMMFPAARILRMDRDSLHGKHALSRMHQRILKHEVDFVVGTQLITKGHDFPNVTLVGVILADLSLNIPDFRAGERTFQLLTQVAGRAGRANKQGEVLIQTYNPKHHSLQCAKEHDTQRFHEKELKQRETLSMPPFFRLALIVCSSPRKERAEYLVKSLQSRFIPDAGRVKIIGPMESPVKKLRNRFRWQIVLKSISIAEIHFLLQRAIRKPLKLHNNELLQIDIDPQHLL